MKTSRFVAGSLLLLATIGLLIWAVLQWRESVIAQQDEKARELATAHLAEGRAQAAVDMIRQQPRPFRHADWQDLELRAFTETRAVSGLDRLYRQHPEILLHSEDGSLLLLRAWLAEGDSFSYEHLRSTWRGHENDPARWILLDADLMLKKGQRDEAKALLQQESLTGRNEAGRLLRLALLTATEDLPTAWTYLSLADQADPKNPEIHSARAQILEAAGRTANARVEYVSAVLSDPSNPLLRDQLAEFYRRKGNLDTAIKTWQDALPGASTDSMWVKALFWSKVVQPVQSPLPDEPPEGPHAALIGLLRTTPSDRFYNFDRNDSYRLINSRPEAVWLGLLDYLKKDEELAARSLLESSSLAAYLLQPDLDTALRQILTFRRTAILPGWNPRDKTKPGSVRCHAFFTELKTLGDAPGGASEKTMTLIQGPFAFSAACLAAGWREAGLVLWGGRPLTGDLPEWYIYALAQSLRYNRGPQDAAELLSSIPSTPLLEMLSAELLLQQAQYDDGCQKLHPLISRADEIGFRAAWLLAITRMEQGRTIDVPAILKQQPALENSVTGRELKARLALADGQIDQAETLYRALANESVEARVWLARRAVEKKNWDEARKLTQELLALMPDEMALRRSLVEIDAAARTP
jgi:predicted Zn-dependent protease